MRLNITRIRGEDFGEYQCVSKNEINTTTATFYIYGECEFFWPTIYIDHSTFFDIYGFR